MIYSKEFLNTVAKAHREKGLTFRVQNRKGKQYISVSNHGVRFSAPLNYWTSHNDLNMHIKSIFPGAYVTSGSWGGNSFDATFRINP